MKNEGPIYCEQWSWSRINQQQWCYFSISFVLSLDCYICQKIKL